MKFVILTDTHFVEPGRLLYGLDPSGRLAAAVRVINRDHDDIAFVIVTGDLAHWGQIAAYVPIAGTWRGIPFHIQRATNHQVAFDLVLQEIPSSFEAPDYTLVSVTAGAIVIHQRPFLYDGPVYWLHDKAAQDAASPAALVG